MNNVNLLTKTSELRNYLHDRINTLHEVISKINKTLDILGEPGTVALEDLPNKIKEVVDNLNSCNQFYLHSKTGNIYILVDDNVKNYTEENYGARMVQFRSVQYPDTTFIKHYKDFKENFKLIDESFLND